MQGNDFSVATLFTRPDGGVSGMGLRSGSSWMLGKPREIGASRGAVAAAAATFKPLTSKKATAADWAKLPPFSCGGAIGVPDATLRPAAAAAAAAGLQASAALCCRAAA